MLHYLEVVIKHDNPVAEICGIENVYLSTKQEQFISL